MIGLQIARVVVIDDKPEDVRSLLRALARRGISAVYLEGPVGDPDPDCDLRGVRLVFLDLRLIDATGGGGHAAMRTTVEYFQSVVGDKPSGLGLVIWSQHANEDKEEFETALKEQMPDFSPVFIKPLPKADFLNEDPDHNQLMQLCTELLTDAPAHEITLEWEQLVMDALNETTNSLHDATKSDNSLLLAVQSKLASAVRGGASGESSAKALEGYYEGMGVLLHDKLSSFHVQQPGEHGEKLREAINAAGQVGHDLIAELNRVLLIDQHAEPTKLREGNIYTNKSNFTKPQITQLMLARDSLDDIVKLVWSFFNEDKNREKLDLFLSDAVPCVLDITPACDYANSKAEVARFIWGVWIKRPDKMEGLPKTIYKEGQLLISSGSKQIAKITPFIKSDAILGKGHADISLLLVTKRAFSLRVNQLERRTPIARMRSEFTKDIQAWHASYAARPGHTDIT